MAIFKIKKIWYVDYYVGIGSNRKRVRKAVGKKKQDAIAYNGKIQGAKRENKLFDVKKEYVCTFDDLLMQYKENFKEQNNYRTKQCHFKVFKSFFSGKMLVEIRPYDLENFRNKRKATHIISSAGNIVRERTVADVNRILSTLRHMLSKAVEWEMLELSPFSKVKNLFYKENNKRLRFLTEYEAKWLVFHCKDHLKPIVICALHTGMRKGEILTLKWVYIRNGFIYLHKTKTSEARQIPINETLKQLFTTLPRHIKSDYVFCNDDGKPYNEVRRSFNTALRKAGIDDFRFHDLRHTFASRLVMKGASLKAVQELLGHKSIKMTMRYAHLSEDFKKEAVRLLDGDTVDSSLTYKDSNID